MSRMSRDKGKRGELELAQLFRDHGIAARRGQQFKGGADSPDIVHELPGYHVECKRTERFSLYAALEQAMGERADGDVPVVFHRANQRGWVVVLNAADFLALAKATSEQEQTTWP